MPPMIKDHLFICSCRYSSRSSYACSLQTKREIKKKALRSTHITAISAVSEICWKIYSKTNGTKNSSATTNMRIAVHMLSHRKKLIHFFLVRENIGEKLGIILKIKNLFYRHLKKLSELHRERKTWSICTFFYRYNGLTCDSHSIRENVLGDFLSRTEFGKNVFYEIF